MLSSGFHIWWIIIFPGHKLLHSISGKADLCNSAPIKKICPRKKKPMLPYSVKAYDSDLMVSIVVLPRIRIRSGIFFHAWGWIYDGKGLTCAHNFDSSIPPLFMFTCTHWHCTGWSTLWLFNSSPWKITMLLIGKPSISMGHLYHGYVSHNQRVNAVKPLG